MPGKALTNDQDGRTSRNDERVENGRQNGEVGDGNDGFLEDYVHGLENLEIPPPPPPVQSFDGTGPRLLITKIVNENFKSYYGRHTLGPFHKNFTSIVGPNGSGKSNVIDSLLFVFGYRAQRIRSKNVSVLIHNSELHPNVNYCTVEVHFVKVVDKDSNDFDVVPNSAFVISRTAHRNNSSDYYIDGRRVQFKDVGFKLRQHGIDIDHNRFLILQGEVEQISLMKPKAQAEGEEGMLEYLEDIVGSSRLKPFLDGLQKRMDELNEMRNDKAQRAKTIEDEKAELEEPKNEAVAYLELENKITRKKNILFQHYVMEVNESCQTVIREREIVKTDFDEKQKGIQEIKSEIKGKQQAFLALKKKHDELQKEIDKQEAKFKELDRADTRLREDLKHGRNQAATMEAQKEAEKKKLKEFQTQPEKCEKQLQELQDKIKELEAKRADADERLQDGLSRLHGETKAAQDEKKVLEEKLIDRQQIVAQAREKMELAKGELELCMSAQTREQAKFDDMKATLARITQSLDECEGKIAEAEKAIPEKEKQLQKLDRRFKEVAAEERDLAGRIRENTSRVGVAAANLQSSGNRSRVLDALFNQQRRGNLKGVLGRLGDLAAIDEKYDVAISTACGPLDNVVVETIDTAQKCVDFLKANNVGSATFIALDKMKRYEQTMRQPMQTPENVPRLFDLLVVDDQRVLPAFYYALRDTLVANDLDQATRVAYHGGRAKHRVVTLQGEIIDVSGTMSGGGNRQSRGRMGRSVATPNHDDMTPEQLKKAESDLAKDRARLDELRVLKLQLETDRDKLGPEIQRKKMDLNSWRMDLGTLPEQKRTMEKQVQAQEKAVRAAVPDEGERKRLTALVEQYQKEFDKVYSTSAAIQKEVGKVDEKIREIKERCVGCIEKEMDAYRRQIDDAEKAMTKSKLAAKTAQRNIRNSEEKLAGLEQDIEANKATLEKVLHRLQEVEDEGVNVKGARDEAEKEMKSFESDLHEAKKAVNDMEEELQKLESSLIDIKTKFDHVEATLKTFQHKKKYWENEHRKLELHDIRRILGLPPVDPAPKPLPEPQPPASEEAALPNGHAMENGEHDEEGQENGDGESEEERPENEGENNTKEKADEGEDLSIELKTFTEEYLKAVNTEALKLTLTMMEEHLNEKNVNLDVLNEYRKKEEKHQKILRELDTVTNMRDQYRDRYEELRKQRLNEFMDGFGIISSKLKEMYQMITLGGDADLELIDTMDPFTEGIAFSVRPPKKSWKQIANLSGGEKTLSSLSLVFALHHYKPTPLYVMDEIDAALDFKNVSIVAHYIKERTKNAQFIIISLRNNMFELADRLVGIYKTHHCTKTAVIDPGKICLKPRRKPVKISSSQQKQEPPPAAAAATVIPKEKRAVLRDRSFSLEANGLPNGDLAAEPEATATDKMRMTPLHI